MNSKVFLVGIAVLLLAGAAAYFAFGRGAQPAGPGIPEKTVETEGVKVFNISGTPFAFAPNEIKVKKGDKVKINFKNDQGFHDLTIPELNLKTAQLQVGQSASLEFTADKAGIFEFYCSVPTHKDKGMIGKLIVEEEGQSPVQTVVSPTEPAETISATASPTKAVQNTPIPTGVDNRRGADKPED